MKYKITNNAKDVRKFRDNFRGKDVFVEPGKSVLTNSPPIKSEVWTIDIQEKKGKKETKFKEVKNNDSSSNNRRMDGDLSDSNIGTRRK